MFLYHLVPKNMKGDILYPLNRLKDVHPDLYEEAVKKYEGREYVLDAKIPPLDGCLWNDVLHMTAVHPKDLENALSEAGSTLTNRRFFEIDPKLLDSEKTTVYLMQDKSMDRHSKIENYEKFKVNELEKFSKIPQRTKKYFKNSIIKNKPVLLFAFIPHILFHGEINTSGLSIIEI